MSRDAASSSVSRFRQILALLDLRKIMQSMAGILSKQGRGSLANRILVLQFLWAFIIYVLVIAALWFATNLIIEKSVRHQAEAWVAKLDEMGIPIYAANDPAQLKDIITYLRNFPEVASAQYLDSSGTKVLAEYNRDDSPANKFAPLPPNIIDSLAKTDVQQKTLFFEKGADSTMRISAPIWVKSIANDGLINYSLDAKSEEKRDTIGFINIVLDYRQISANLNRNIFYASVFIALMIFIAAFIARALVRWALKPLSALEEPLTRLANGETDVTVDTSGDEEIARIGMALNTTIKALKERDDTLRQLANQDALTGLANRKYFIERLEHEIKRVARGGGSGALFFFDLDRFKNINDTYGHAAGDRLLVQIAKLLNRRIRESDLLARFGGDEFTLLAYNVDQRSAREIAESFIELMRDFTFHEGGDMLKIYFSIGLTVIDDGKLSAQDYLNEADAAAHQAKALGRNGHRLFARGKTQSDTEIDVGWHERLQEVLHKRQAILYYQPLAGLKGQSDKINEVLLRLPDSNDMVLSPSSFMPAAERFGMMADFDCLVIGMAAQCLAELKNPHAAASVNLSAQFFSKDDIPEFLESIITAHQIAPSQLIFELPARFVVRNIEKLQAIITGVAQRGYRIAVDDFGIGFLSFDYIKHFPVHFLKIDGALIEHITVDNIARATVRAIVEVANELKMQTVAKSAGDEAGLGLLRELGIDYAQGNYIAVPAPVFRTYVAAAKNVIGITGDRPRLVK